MDRDRLLELLHAYQDQCLTEADRLALNAALRASAEARRLFWEYAYQQAFLLDLLAESRGRELAQEERALQPAEPAPAQTARGWRRSALVPLLSSLALLLLLGLGLAWFVGPSPDSDPGTPLESAGVLARLQELRGEVQVIGAESTKPGRAGQVIRPGEEIRTGTSGFAVVTYPDSSRLEINAETAVRLLADAWESGPSSKRIFLVEGVVNALVAPQPHGKPMQVNTLQAKLLATGNRFSSASVLGETRIEMEEGKAFLFSKSDDRLVEIHGGSFAVASPEVEVFRPVPLLPNGTAPEAVIEDSSGPIMALAAVDRGQTLAIGCWNGVIKLWDLKRRRLQAVLPAEQRRVLSLASAPEGRFLAAGYEPVPRRPEDVDNLILWDVPRQQIDRTFPVPRRVHTLATTQDSRTLVLGTAWRPGVSVWDLPARPSRLEGVGMERLRLGERHERPRVLALGPDDRTIAAGHPDGTIRLWDLHTGRPLRTLQGHQRDVQALAFQPGGRLLASGGRDGSVRLWSVDTGEQVHLLPGKLGEARCLAFSPDGLTLVSGHGGIAQLWDVKTGVPRSTMRAHKFAITSLVFLDQGRLLATAGWDRTVKLWKLQPGTAGAL